MTKEIIVANHYNQDAVAESKAIWRLIKELRIPKIINNAKYHEKRIEIHERDLGINIIRIYYIRANEERKNIKNYLNESYIKHIEDKAVV